MKELISTTGMMTSRVIAEITGKRHDHILDAIRKMEPAWVKSNRPKFRVVEYTDAKGENRPEYQLSKTECLYIATKFNDEARAKLVIRWEELETKNRQFDPTALSRMDILKIAMKAEEDLVAERTRNTLLSQEVEKKEAIIEHLEPKASLADRLMQSSSTVDVRTFAGLINRQPNNFFETLRQDGFLISFGERRNQPIAKYNGKYFKTEAKTWIEKKSRKACTFVQTRITGPGMLFLFKKYVHDADKNKVGPILLDFLSNQKQSNHDHHFNSNSKGYIDASLGNTR